MADDTYTSNRRLNTGASDFNAISFLVEQMLKGCINTAIPVRVDACTVNSQAGSIDEKGKVQPSGYVSATPLVMQRGADGKSITPVSIPQLPYYRNRAGTAAFILDPQPGDVGLAVFAQQDISGLKQEGTDPVPAGSFRSFDMSDGVFFPSMLGPAPRTWILLDPVNNKIEINAPLDVVVRSEGASIGLVAQEEIVLKSKNIRMEAGEGVSTTAGTGVTTKAPQVATTSPAIAMNGPISTFGVDGTGPGSMTIKGTMNLVGSMTATNTVTAPNFSGTLHGNVDGYCKGAHG